MTLWEILKANKTGIAPDMFTMLAASKMNGGRDRLHELSGIPPLSFTAKGKPLTSWHITGNTVQNGTPTPENPVEVQAVGDYDTTTGKYKIPITTKSEDGSESITTPIYLPTPLYSGEVIRSDGTITRSDGTTETFTAPQIPTLNGTTVIDVDTAVKPESVTIKYRR